MKKIAPRECVHEITSELKKLGFTLRHKSRNGSRYLRWPGSPFEIRLSDHRTTDYGREQHPQVVKTYVPPPMEASEIAGTALDIAIGFFARTRIRLGRLGEISGAEVA